MPVTACVTDQYKQDVMNGVHQPTDAYKIALYLQANATLDKTTTAYTVTGEISGTGYAAGGLTLTGFTVGLSGDTAYLTFSNPVWNNATFTADAAVIYNSTRTNKAVAVLTFNSTTSTGASWTLQLPAAGASAIITLT